jgi:hypothetical protein
MSAADATIDRRLARPPHVLRKLESRSAVCGGYVVDFARWGLSQQQNND